jgi:hypothetical protein
LSIKARVASPDRRCFRSVKPFFTRASIMCIAQI